jgi:HNH endonuclease/AP2 domain
MKNILKPPVTLQRVQQLLQYFPETGDLMWRVSRRGRGCGAGNIAGGVNKNGYRYVGIDGHLYFSHRIVWLIVHGEWPIPEIDHINGNKTDNRIGNLRVVTRSQNLSNRPKPRNNTSGVKGVCLHKPTGKWLARINARGISQHLGLFANIDDAAIAYKNAAFQLHGEYARIT